MCGLPAAGGPATEFTTETLRRGERQENLVLLQFEKSPPCRHVALHVLQFLQGPPNVARHSGDGSGLNGSCLVASRIGRAADKWGS